MRRRLCLAIITCVAVLPFPMPAAGAESVVRIVDDAFRPKKLTVSRGTKVVWRWTGEHAHNVTVDSGPVLFHSTTKRDGTFKRRMWRRGTYRIVCTIHMPDQRMTLKVTR
jgi:plastocyanin